MTGLLVALGAAAGAALRFLSGHLLDGRVHWGTLLVNLTGSALLGVLIGRDAGGWPLALIGTGFCGGLTTYSAFAVQTAGSARERPVRGLAYGLGTVVGCLACVCLGYAAGATL